MPVPVPTMPAKSTPWELPTLVHVDPLKPGNTQPDIHTRWHPDIPCVASIELDKPFRVECMDYAGFQLGNDDCADDVLDMDHDSDHHLSGPFFVPGAQPGDVLEIDILEVAPLESQPWGYCITVPGIGSLDHPDRPTQITKTIWDFAGREATSRHVPHVAFQARAFPGVIGTAPSAELLAEWTRREAKVDATRRRHGGGDGISLPLERGAYVGQDLDPELRARIYREGARTGPGREHGGNIDIANITGGSKVFLPVFVHGAKLSVGDLHFCQSDGEPTTALEMPGVATLRVNVIRDGVALLGLRAPMYQSSPSEPQYPNRLVFTGLSLDHDGEQLDCDGRSAYRNAAFSAMQYLERQGYTREQAYVILSAAPVEAKVVATANQPNFVISVGLPVDIFDFDILPKSLGRPKPPISGPAVLSEDGARRFAAALEAARLDQSVRH